MNNLELIKRITNYLSLGGLFNPEMMEHEKVRDLLMDIQDHLMELECQPYLTND